MINIFNFVFFVNWHFCKIFKKRNFKIYNDSLKNEHWNSLVDAFLKEENAKFIEKVKKGYCSHYWNFHWFII